MSPDFLIDGYNLMHFAGLARARYGPGDLERSRNRLLKLLQRLLTPQERSRTTVVFDARDAPHSDRVEREEGGMLIVFSPAGLEADDIIEDWIATHSAPKRLVVVSGDHRLRRAAATRKARAIGSEGFLDEYRRRASQAAHQEEKRVPSKPEHVPSGEELEEWLDLFDVDVRDVVRDVERETRAGSKCPPPSHSPEPPVPDRTGEEAAAGPDERPNREAPLPQSQEAERKAPVVPDELSFWERRVAELFEEGERDEP